MPRWLLPLVLTAVSLSAPALHAADAKVKVELASGRAFQGILDSRTDDQQLWLRWRVGDVQLQRPIAWEGIASASLNGNPIEIDELKARAAELATPGRTAQLRPAKHVPAAPATPVVDTIVQSIRCDAWLANWDADAQFDGLAVEIEAFDRNGLPIVCQGTVEAELLTIDYQPGYLASTEGGRVPVSLGRWAQPWESQRRYVQLEMQGRQPQTEGSLSRYALLKLRVTIPGSGVFEQQIDGLRTRPFTPVSNLLKR